MILDQVLRLGSAVWQLGNCGPRYLGFVAMEGQQVHTVEIPEELQNPQGLADIHKSHRVHRSGDTARLIEHRPGD